MTTHDQWNPDNIQHSSSPSYQEDDREVLSNVIDSWKDGGGGDRIQIRLYRAIGDVSDNLRDATKGWPRVTGGMLFVATRNPPKDGQEQTGSIRYFNKAPALFAWIQERCSLRWSMETCTNSKGEHDPRTPCTKDEFFSHLKDANPFKYVGTSVLPHEPAMPGVYYMPMPSIPGNPAPDQMTGKLDEFLASLNPDSEMDRELLRAMIVTLAWGGDPGTRPAFVLSSVHGRGAGKSATAEAIGNIFGGFLRIDPKEQDWDKTRSRLLDDEGLDKRMVLIDNVKGKINSASFESLLTARVIDGKRMYYGQFSRPNYLTWIITSNTPKLSEDMTVRSVEIRIGKKKHGDDWIAWSTEFIRKHRLEIIHDCLVTLRRAPLCELDRSVADRFQGWQRGVLCRCSPRANQLAELVGSRRTEINADIADAQEVAHAVHRWCMTNNMARRSDGRHQITRKQMREILVAEDIIGHDMTTKGVHSWLSDLRSCDALSPMGEIKSERLWVWDTNAHQSDGEIPY